MGTDADAACKGLQLGFAIVEVMWGTHTPDPPSPLPPGAVEEEE